MFPHMLSESYTIHTSKMSLVLETKGIIVPSTGFQTLQTVGRNLYLSIDWTGALVDTEVVSTPNVRRPANTPGGTASRPVETLKKVLSLRHANLDTTVLHTVFPRPTNDVAVNALVHQQSSKEMSMLPCWAASNL
jgi:hypothetical protein